MFVVLVLCAIFTQNLESSRDFCVVTISLAGLTFDGAMLELWHVRVALDLDYDALKNFIAKKIKI